MNSYHVFRDSIPWLSRSEFELFDICFPRPQLDQMADGTVWNMIGFRGKNRGSPHYRT